MTPENLINEIINYLKTNTQITSCIIKLSYHTVELININNSLFQLDTRTQYAAWAKYLPEDRPAIVEVDGEDTIKSTLMEANLKIDEISRISESLFKILNKFILSQVGNGLGRFGIDMLLNRSFGEGYLYKKE